MNFHKNDSDYEKAHRIMRKERGSAKLHNCVDCGNPAIDMSHIHDTDPFDSINYDPRCRKCHSDYDKINVGSKNKNAKLIESDVLEIRRLYSTKLFTQKEIGEKYGVAEQTIGNIINRRKWGHV